jgi:hypothetical protein
VTDQARPDDVGPLPLVVALRREGDAWDVAANHHLAHLLHGAADEIVALKASLTVLVVAAGRMRDGWAEGDAAYRNQLWGALHQAADDADERHGIYPL